MRKLVLIAVLAAAAAPALPARAQDAAAPAPAAPATPPASQPGTTQPATGEVVDVKDFAKLKEMEGKPVAVRGTVSDTFTPASGSVTILNFEGLKRRDFNVVIRKANLDAVNAGFGGDVAGAVKGHTITVTGPIAIYKARNSTEGNPQIDVSKPEQIKVEPGEAKPAEPKEPATPATPPAQEEKPAER